jgi:hypothetical protein
MFTLSHEITFEVNAPLPRVWKYCVNPANWSKWEKAIVSCELKGEFKTGAQVKIQVKNGSANLLITEVDPYRSYKALWKSYVDQETACFFEVISLETTKVIYKTSVVGILLPLLRIFITKKYIDKKMENMKKVLIEDIDNLQKNIL